MLKLVRLTGEYKRQLQDMMAEWLSYEQGFSPYVIRKNDYREFDYYLKNLENKDESNGLVCDSTWFLYDTERDMFLGAINIRHHMNERLLIDGGHIGDGIRPSERRKGYATKMIGLALEECKRLGIYDVLMTCDKDNVGSAKSIMYNGGVLENEIQGEDEITQRYWIHLDGKPVIKEYENGVDFLKDNRAFLERDIQLTQFMILDAEYYKEKNTRNYALSIGEGDKRLVAINVEPFKLMVYGNTEYAHILVQYLYEKGYFYDSYLCDEEIGDALNHASEEILGISYYEGLAMDFMEANEITDPSDCCMVAPKEEDLKEIHELSLSFIKDCNLLDQITLEGTRRKLPDFRILRMDGKIVSMAYYHESIGKRMKISWVYTRPEYRGRGLCRSLVNAIKNDILKQGFIASLNVDQKNPISNHVYSSIGFQKEFSQGEYRRK